MNQYILAEIGEKIRKIRKEKDLTVQMVASRAGVSKGLISRIENNRTVPSVPVLIAIIKGLECSLSSFFGDIDRYDLEKVIIRKADELKSRAEITSDHLRKYPIIDKSVPESLIRTSILELKPAGKIDYPSQKGFSFQYILEGQLHYIIEETSYNLNAGDSLYFDARQAHSIENKGAISARLLAVDFVI